MPEGLSATEVGKEIGEHAKHANGHTEKSRRDRLISIAEAVLLSIVTITAAWSGYSAAKWGTESSLKLAKASATRTKANRYFQEGLSYRTADALLFNAWFGAYIAGNKDGMRVAEKRFRPQFEVAFVAWLATHPFTNPNAPQGPQAMPQYKPVGEALSRSLDSQANAFYAEGEKCGRNGRQLRTRHRGPRERALPHRDQHPVLYERCAVRASRNRRIAAALGGRTDPLAARPAVRLVEQRACSPPRPDRHPAPARPGEASLRVRYSCIGLLSIAGARLSAAVWYQLA